MADGRSQVCRAVLAATGRWQTKGAGRGIREAVTATHRAKTIFSPASNVSLRPVKARGKHAILSVQRVAREIDKETKVGPGWLANHPRPWWTRFVRAGSAGLFSIDYGLLCSAGRDTLRIFSASRSLVSMLRFRQIVGSARHHGAPPFLDDGPGSLDPSSRLPSATQKKGTLPITR